MVRPQRVLRLGIGDNAIRSDRGLGAHAAFTRAELHVRLDDKCSANGDLSGPAEKCVFTHGGTEWSHTSVGYRNAPRT